MKRDMRDPQAMGETLLTHTARYRNHRVLNVQEWTLAEAADYFAGTLEDHVPDYVDGDTIAKYGDPRERGDKAATEIRERDGIAAAEVDAG